MLYMSLLDRGDLWYFPHSNSMPIDRLLSIEPQIRQKFADLSSDGTMMLKRIRPQKRIDPFRKYFPFQAKREVHSAKFLAKLGIRTPLVNSYGFNLSPFGAYESVLLMKYIPNIGTLREILEEEASEEVYENLLDNLLSYLRKMIHAGVYHKDVNFGNILVTRTYNLIWIDNDISPIKSSKEYNRLFKKLLNDPLLERKGKKKIRELFSQYHSRFAN